MLRASPLCTCHRHYPGAATGCPLRSLPQSWQPSPKWRPGRPTHCPFRGLLSVHSRYGLHTRWITQGDPLHQRLQPLRYLHDCSDCFRLERKLPGGTFTHRKDAALARRTPTADGRALTAKVCSAAQKRSLTTPCSVGAIGQEASRLLDAGMRDEDAGLRTATYPTARCQEYRSRCKRMLFLTLIKVFALCPICSQKRVLVSSSVLRRDGRVVPHIDRCAPWRAKRGRVVPGRRRRERIVAVAKGR